MPRKKFDKLKGGTSFMYPSLHEDVVNAVSDDITSVWFHKNDSDHDSNNEYSTHVMATFKCRNNACSTNGWSSKKVAILIRGYPRNGYNAVVFNQRCRECNKLGMPLLDEESYVDRVAYRLKKWASVDVEPPCFDPKKGPPHVRALCEGCKKGICKEGNSQRDNSWEYS